MGDWKRAIVIFMIYYALLFIGAAIIMYIEEAGLRGNKHYPANSTKILDELFNSVLNIQLNESSIKRVLKLSQEIARQEQWAANTQWKKEISWRTFYKWRYFTHTTLTTVGFGDIVPQTDGGKIFVILYSIIGIPLNLFVTATIGFLFSASLKKMIQHFEKRVLKCSSPKHVEKKMLITLLMLSLGWLSLGAEFASQTMQWSYIEALYAGFIKFSTIGYGDYTLDFAKVSKYWEVLSWFTNISLALVTGIFDAITQVITRKEDRFQTAIVTENGVEEMSDVI